MELRQSLLLSGPFLMKSSPKSPQIRHCCQWTRRPLPSPRPSPSVPKEKASSSLSLLRVSRGGLRRRSQNETAKDRCPHEESISHMTVDVSAQLPADNKSSTCKKRLMSELSPRLQTVATSFDNSLRRCRETPQDACLSAASSLAKGVDSSDAQPVVLEFFAGLNCGGVMGRTEGCSERGTLLWVLIRLCILVVVVGGGSQTELLRRENGQAQPGGGPSPAHAA
ncbi:hypothetical protein Q8A73_017887 [Channa argus]|nr:hypothetical protein Q8A73_017887 [Channa argus]